LLLEVLDAHQNIQVKILRLPVRGPEDLEGDVTEFTEVSTRLSGEFVRILVESSDAGLDFQAAFLGAMNDPGVPGLGSELFDAVVEQHYAVGSTVTPAMVLPHPAGIRGYLPLDVSLEDSLVGYPGAPSGVRWNGERGGHEWSDRNLRRSTYLVASELLANPKAFREGLFALPADVQTKFRRNSEGARPQEKIEPFDLIRGALMEGQSSIWMGEPTSRVSESKSLHRALYLVFGMNAEDDPIGSELPDLWVERPERDDREHLIVACTRAWEEPMIDPVALGSVAFVRGLVSYSGFRISELISSEQPERSFSCGNKVYDLRLVALAADPMSVPPPYDLTKFAAGRPAEVLVSFSLTTEVTPQVLQFLKAYLNLQGFRPQGGIEVVKTKETFLEGLSSADVLIPVAHSLDVNNFHVGTETSNQLVFEKIYPAKTGEDQAAQIRILFPNLRPDENSTVLLTSQELGEAMRKRRTVRPNSLVVLHTSCYGESNLRAWTQAFRRALERERDIGNIESISDAQDVPLVYAFRGGFPTTTPFDLLTSMLYPLGAIGALAEGSNGEELLAMLMAPAPESLLYRFFDFVVRLIPGFELPSKVPNYQPVWNLSYPQLLMNDDYEFVISDRDGIEPIRRYLN
jgi:hypothetical protein